MSLIHSLPLRSLWHSFQGPKLLTQGRSHGKKWINNNTRSVFTYEAAGQMWGFDWRDEGEDEENWRILATFRKSAGRGD